MGAHKNRLSNFNEHPQQRFGKAILMNTHNIGFYEDLTKIVFHLSSNTHLTTSSATCTIWVFCYHCSNVDPQLTLTYLGQMCLL